MKRQLSRFRILPDLIAVVILLLGTWGCGSMEAGKVHLPHRSQQSIRTLDFQPLAYFDQHCSRCHGPFGSFYGKEFARDLSPAALQQKVAEMAAGPGGAPLSGDSLAALVAFHQSLSTQQPFIVVTKSDDDSLSGEVTPNVPLRISCGDQSTVLPVKGYQWAAEKPKWLGNCPPGSLRIAAGPAGHESVLNPAESAYSHPVAVTGE